MSLQASRLAGSMVFLGGRAREIGICGLLLSFALSLLASIIGGSSAGRWVGMAYIGLKESYMACAARLAGAVRARRGCCGCRGPVVGTYHVVPIGMGCHCYFYYLLRMSSMANKQSLGLKHSQSPAPRRLRSANGPKTFAMWRASALNMYAHTHTQTQVREIEASLIVL
jgi:hypothetical protein